MTHAERVGRELDRRKQIREGEMLMERPKNLDRVASSAQIHNTYPTARDIRINESIEVARYARSLEGRIERVELLHPPSKIDEWCEVCDTKHPCELLRILRGEIE